MRGRREEGECCVTCSLCPTLETEEGGRGRGEGKAAAAELFSLSFYIPLSDFHPSLPPSLPLLLARIVRWEIEGRGVGSEWGGGNISLCVLLLLLLSCTLFSLPTNSNFDGPFV